MVLMLGVEGAMDLKSVALGALRPPDPPLLVGLEASMRNFQRLSPIGHTTCIFKGPQT